MEHEDIKNSLNNIEPNDMKKQKLWGKVLTKSQKKETLSFNKVIPIATVILFLAIVSALVFSNMSNDKGKNALTSPETNKSRNSFTQPATLENAEKATDSMNMMISQMQIDNKFYSLADDESLKSFGFSKTVDPKDIGQKITTISSIDNSELKGCDVFEFNPAKSRAIVAVKIGSEYQLYKFIAFQSYWNNQDEDALAYLKLYGINESTDIEKIQFISHDEQSKINGTVNIKKEITDAVEISSFYNLYSEIKNASDVYFNMIMGDKPQQAPIKEKEINPSNGNIPTVAPDQIPADASREKPTVDDNTVSSTINPSRIPTTNESGKIIDSTGKGGPPTVDLPAASGSSSGLTAPSQGSVGDAFFNSVTIRIIAKTGVYYDTEYYPNIGFISRQEVTEQLRTFLKGYLE